MDIVTNYIIGDVLLKLYSQLVYKSCTRSLHNNIFIEVVLKSYKLLDLLKSYALKLYVS